MKNKGKYNKLNKYKFCCRIHEFSYFNKCFAFDSQWEKMCRNKRKSCERKDKHYYKQISTGLMMMREMKIRE